MLKKIWRKICGFYYALAVFYEVITIYVGYGIMFFGVSPILGFFVTFFFVSVLIAPILGLMWLYDWLCSLF